MADSQYINGTLSVMMSTKGLNAKLPLYVSLQSKLCPSKGCYTPPSSGYGPPLLWSSTATWPSGILPIAGNDIVIASTMWVVIDKNPPKSGILFNYQELLVAFTLYHEM